MNKGTISKFLATVPVTKMYEQPYSQILWHLEGISPNLPCFWGEPETLPSDLPKWIGGPSKHYTKAYGWEVKYYGVRGQPLAISAKHESGAGFWLRWDQKVTA